MVWGITPPPKHRRPPAAVKPEMALVTDMSGVCKAGLTDHTLWYPVITAKEKVVTIPKKTGSGHKTPRPIMELNPMAPIAALLKVC